MTTYNDEFRKLVTAAGFNTGCLPQDAYNYYKAYTGQTAFRTRQELERRWIIAIGVAPNVSLNKMWNDVFIMLGFTGSFNDKLLKWAMEPLPLP